MIVLNLSCSNNHTFEGWFASIEVFQAQSDGRQITCPRCNSNAIDKLPAGPYIKRTRGGGVADPAAESVRFEAKLRNALQELLRDSDDVGTRFPEEARKIHYAEAPARSIHGTASAAEVISLLEEDIGVIPLPNLPGGNIH